MNPLGQFVYLQGLDVLTTLACLGNGVKEANPVVSLALAVAPSPLGGLLGIKVLAIALAVYCWQGGKTRVLARINVFFAAVVVWNLVALILGSPAFL